MQNNELSRPPGPLCDRCGSAYIKGCGSDLIPKPALIFYSDGTWTRADGIRCAKSRSLPVPIAERRSAGSAYPGISRRPEATVGQG